MSEDDDDESEDDEEEAEVSLDGADFLFSTEVPSLVKLDLLLLEAIPF